MAKLFFVADSAEHATLKSVITGYNTDVEHDGVVYHVQTEDKGTRMPLILSLVYVGGAILVSKRSPYDDLINDGFDEGVLAERLQRQHNLICAAIHAGRIEDLKRLSRPDASDPLPVTETAEQVLPPAEEELSPPADEEVVAAPPKTEAVSPKPVYWPPTPRRVESAVAEIADTDHALRVTLLDDREFRSGEVVTVGVRVTRGSGAWERVVPGARVVFKTLGSTFRPAFTNGVTARDGMASAVLSFPVFKSGRAAVLVRVEMDGETAELRRAILPRS